MANNDVEMTLLKRIIIDKKFSTRKMEPIDVKFYLRKRYLVMLLMFFGMALSVVLKTNLSIVLMDITYPKYVLKGNTTIYQKPQVDWNSKEAGFIIGTSTYGQILGIFFAGISAKKYGGTTLLGCGLFVSSLFACATPAVLINYSRFWIFIVVRIIEGVGTGFVEGSLGEVCLNWSPINERARFTGTIAMSVAFGVILSNLVTGYGIHYLNWQSVFFVTGGTGIILSIVCLLFVKNRPYDDKFMSNIERRYLETKINLPCDKDLKILSYPWKEIFTSKPVWAYLNEWFCCGWSGSFVTYSLPFYIKDVAKFDTKNVAVMSSVPILCSLVSEFIFANVHDYIRSYKRFENSNIHRIIISAAHFGVAASLITLALGVNFEASLILISLIRILLGIKYVYYNVIPVDVFYRYAVIIRSFGSISLVLTNCLTPLLAGFIVTNHERSQWSIFFGLLVVFNIFSVFVFCRYGSFELQSWASVQPIENEKKSYSS